MEKQKEELRAENQLLMDEMLALKADMVQVNAQKQILFDELEANNDYVLQMEEKVYKSNKISLELLK